jgi:membrane-bound hydrogenase subunit beta
MKADEDILAELTTTFPFLQGKVRIQRDRRVWCETPADHFREVFGHLFKKMDFTMLTAITGLDMGANLAALYHLVRPGSTVLNLSVQVPKDNPVLPTVTDYFPAAECPERELIDLLGMKVEGLPPGMRYPLPDGWPEGQYPLRKDWKAEQLKGIQSIGAVIPTSLAPSQEIKNA